MRLAGIARRRPTSSKSAPGVGSLTVALVDAGAHVAAVELDRHLLPVLEEVVGARRDDRERRVRRRDDARLVDAARIAERWAMVSNLPYNVATPVVVRVLEDAPTIDRFLVMVQREVGERLAARSGTSQYGAVSVKVAYYADAEVVGIVAPTVFVPRPNVESALVQARPAMPPPVARADPAQHVRAGARRLRDAPQDAAQRVGRRVLGDRAADTLRRGGIDPIRPRRDARPLDDGPQLAAVPDDVTRVRAHRQGDALAARARPA